MRGTMLMPIFLAACATAPDGAMVVDWSEARSVYDSCEVALIAQSHDRWVLFEMTDGRRIASREPEIDMIYRLSESGACDYSGLLIATE